MDAISADLPAQALDELRRAAGRYRDLYGDAGLNLMGEDLCRIVAYEVAGDAAWANLVAHLQRISG
ncbi:hypothetical protein [Stenotrophomonas sp. B1-1]|uniref:hypothetical protein n=1 Tax=Stenotrophomonas sp. B1-1 TaxID=2710648 RepID=UPI0013DCCCAE|nr:hypothetical protein [Stenotrophomonas sp. B1-1]